MIIAVENTELYRYEIHSLLKAFYPSETVKVFVGEPDRRRFPDPVFLEVFFGPGKVKMTMYPHALRSDTLLLHGLHPGEDLWERESEAPKGIYYDRKSAECKTAAKHLLYRMLAALTGQELPWGELIGIRPTKIAMTRLREGDTHQEAAAFMCREHYVSRQKAELAVDIAERERRILSDIHYEDGYSLYVGIPFCPTTCLYCSFTSFPLAAWRGHVDQYLDALEKEIEAAASLMKGRVLDTVYIGGGTPTTLEPDQLDRLIGMLRAGFPMDNLLEFTVEAGRPDSITPEKLRVLRENGVGRISVNPQTMSDETLRFIGRKHTAEQTVEAFHMAREAGFDNINMDIILGLPGENEEDVLHTVSEIEKLRPDDLTVHSLAVKRGSRLQKWIERNGISSINNTDECMKIAAEGASRIGLTPYYLYRQKNMSGNFENVGYAREGSAGIYNILIMEEKQTIMALGAGSISKAVLPGGRIERSDNCKDVTTYLENIDEMIARKRKLFACAADNS